MQQDPSDQRYYDVDKFNGIISVKLSFGTITAQVTPLTLTAFENTQYTFSITPEHRVDLNGYIVI
jgi:hypothetical protein